jgi:hypothetical protein
MRGRARMEIVGSIIIQNMPHPYSHAKRGEVFKFSKARGNGHGFPLSNSDCFSVKFDLMLNLGGGKGYWGSDSSSILFRAN